MKLRIASLIVMTLVPVLLLAGCGDDSTVGTQPDTTPPLAPVIEGSKALDGAAGLWWAANNEPDLAGYYVYAAQNGIVHRANRLPIHQSYFVYEMTQGGSVTLYVTAVDLSGNESSPSSVRAFTLSPSQVIDGFGDQKILDGVD